jgi:hypothetical protein
MQDCQRHQKKETITERSNIIPIPQNTFRKNVNIHHFENNHTQYSLKQNFFDPSKSSPPNDFMSKLQTRLSVYDDMLFFTKCDMLTNEE